MKIFDWNANTGSLKDRVSNDLLINNGCKFVRSEKGIVLTNNLTTQQLISNKRFNVSSLNDTSIFIWIKPIFRSSSNSFVLGQYVGGQPNRFVFYYDSTGSLKYFVEPTFVSSPSFSIEFNKWSSIGFTLSSTGQVNIFVNGTNVKSGVNTRTWRDTDFTIFQSLANDKIARVVVYDHILSSYEIQKLQLELEQTFTIEKTKKNFKYPKPAFLSEDGIIFAFDMISVNGLLPDLSGNGNTGTIINCPTRKDGLQSLGHDFSSEVVLTNPRTDTIWTVSFVIDRYKIEGASLDFFLGGTNTRNILLRTSGVNALKVAFRDGVGVYFYWNGTGNTIDVPSSEVAEKRVAMTFMSDETDIHLYVDGVYKGYVTPNTTVFYLLSLLKGYGTSQWTPNVELQHIEYYNTFKDAEYAKSYNNQFANQIYFKEDFKLALADGTNQIPLGWNKGTGSFKIVETIEGKTLECTASGTISIQSKQAYGTWEHNLYKSNRSNTGPIFYNILDRSNITNHNGYVFFANNQNSLLLRRVTNGSFFTLFQTTNDYISEDTLYKVKITRSITGEFKVYIKGGTFGNNYILIESIIGTNPVTDNTYIESTYIVFDVDIGDQISNIVLKKGIAI